MGGGGNHGRGGGVGTMAMTPHVLAPTLPPAKEPSVAASKAKAAASAAASAAAAAAAAKTKSPPLTEAEYVRERKRLADYLHDDKDVAAAVAMIRKWQLPHKHSELVNFLGIEDGLPRRNVDWAALGRLLAALTSAGEGGPLLPGAQLLEALELVCNGLGEAVLDAPMACEHVASLLAVLIQAQRLALKDLGSLLKRAGPCPEDAGLLVADGHALTLLAKTLKGLSSTDVLVATWQASGLVLSDFLGTKYEASAGGDKAKGQLQAAEALGLQVLFPESFPAESTDDSTIVAIT
jgi:hypothetical protein